jgi:hypothetical protein
MPVEVNTPPGFPSECTLRCSGTEDLPTPVILSQIAPLFSDPKVKEAVLSSKGLRLVVLAEEAERTNYLIFRDAELGRQPFPAARLQRLLETLADLHYSQAAQAHDPRKASA